MKLGSRLEGLYSPLKITDLLIFLCVITDMVIFLLITDMLIVFLCVVNYRPVKKIARQFFLSKIKLR